MSDDYEENESVKQVRKYGAIVDKTLVSFTASWIHLGGRKGVFGQMATAARRWQILPRHAVFYRLMSTGSKPLLNCRHQVLQIVPPRSVLVK
jgi:hypothetical protein